MPRRRRADAPTASCRPGLEKKRISNRGRDAPVLAIYERPTSLAPYNAKYEKAAGYTNGYVGPRVRNF